jgi:hypothetical protein
MVGEELIHLMTIMYIAIQEVLDDLEGLAEVRAKLRKHGAYPCERQDG